MEARPGDEPRADLLSLRSRGSFSTSEVRSSGNLRPTAEHSVAGSTTIDIISPPAVHFVLAFHDLTYSVKRTSRSFHRSSEVEDTSTGDRPRDGARMNMLLDGISGEAREGEIMAVLGASGAGKSTLIDALSDRIQRESLRGSVTLNGESLDSRLLRVISAYVMQDDLLYPMLTVAETIMYSAEFRLPRSLSASMKRSRVEQLIDQLGLRAAANTIIGDEGHRGVSGGERRRVSIGVDIIHDPVILFLDEPTSGLDSTSAFTVVKVLQRIAQSGSVVVMSVHQPSHRLLGLFDRLLFLSGGRTVYYGPPAALPSFFSELGQPIPDGANPTEFALDHIRELDGTHAGTEDLVQFNKSWQEKMLSHAVSDPFEKPPLSLQEAISLSVARGKMVAGRRSTSAAGMELATNTEVEAYANPWWVELWILSRRGFTNTRRTLELFLIRFGAVVLTAFILATIFWRLDNTPKGVHERLSFFVIATSTMFYASADALPVFLMERYIFFRETAHNSYRRSSYVLSNAVVAFPPFILLAIALAAITFFALGLNGGFEGFVFFALIVLAAFWAGSGFVTFLSGVVEHVIIGYAVVVSVLGYFMVFSGFFLTRDRIPDYWIWLHYLSLMKYPYEAMMHNEFRPDQGKCFMRGVQMFDGTPMGNLPLETQVSALNAMSKSVQIEFNSSSCFTTGREILEKKGVDQLDKWGCLWATIAWGFLFRALFYIALLLGSKNKRK